MSKNKKAAIGVGIIAIGVGIATFFGFKNKEKIKELIQKKESKNGEDFFDAEN